MSVDDSIDRDASEMLKRALEDSRQEFGSFFLLRLLGMKVTYVADSCVVSFNAARALFNPQGALHGGILATAMDISMGHLLKAKSGAGVTLEMKVQYLAAVRGGLVHCDGRFLRQGRQLAFLTSTAIDAEGNVVAFATSTWKLL